MDSAKCVICQADESSNLSEVKRGIKTLIDYATRFDKVVLESHINLSREKNLKLLIHQSCQKQMSNDIRKDERKILNESVEVLPKYPKRSTEHKFDWKTCCFLCAEICSFDSKHPDRKKSFEVTLLYIKEKIKHQCEQRDDEWASAVKTRIQFCGDLVAAEGRYHIDCYKKFMREDSSSSRGRPKIDECQQNFMKICDWLENSADIFSLGEVHEKMEEIANGTPVYSKKWLKNKLSEKYKEHLVFSEINGKENVLCFKEMNRYLINKLWKEKKSNNMDNETLKIVKAAAKIISDDIRSKTFEKSFYPSEDDMRDIANSNEWVPKYLHEFMQIVIKNSLKRASIEQAIVSASRQRATIPPILLALGLELDHMFGSKWLIVHLSRLGFSVTADEVIRFKQSSIEAEYEKKSDSQSDGLQNFIQWSADNVDHNVSSLDGKNSLHGMGIVESRTPLFGASNGKFAEKVMRRKLQAAKDVVKGKLIPIKPYLHISKSGLSKMFFSPIISLKQPFTQPGSLIFDVLWRSSSIFNPSKRCNWSGYMSTTCTGEYPGKATITLLPIIDLTPSDPTCIYSTLQFVIKQAQDMKIRTPIITFDQPLWLKAMDIVKNCSLDIVCMLGGFHMLMSFLGSIGKTMAASGLEEALETIYGPNVVKHIIGGKDAARALRAHNLVDSALHNLLLEPLLKPDNTNHQLPPPIPPLSKDQISSVESIIVNINGKPEKTSQIIETASEVITYLSNTLELYKEYLQYHSETAKLWIQYLNYLQVVKNFIRAERTGNWSLHLCSVESMLNLFAATGHINYAKSARLYLQNMLNLHKTHPWVYKHFAELGFHTVRRTDKYWSGLWTDLIIEQVLMRSLKSVGGITRGRGVNETVRTQWLASVHSLASIHEVMTDLTGSKYQTSFQHSDLSYSRVKRDSEDMNKLTIFFKEHNPFDNDESQLKSLSTGIIANKEVNCHHAEKIGYNLQKNLDNVKVSDAKVKRSEQIVCLDNLQRSVKCDKNEIQIDPNILFNRLIVLAERNENLEPAFAFELTPEPTALFKNGMMRKTEKAKLRNHFLNDESIAEFENVECVVIDGGALLHRLIWKNDVTVRSILTEYVNYVKNKYNNFKEIFVVFDGYQDPNSLKDHEHNLRKKKHIPNVKIKEDSVIKMRKDSFLSNSYNKEQFISMLNKEFNNAAIHSFQSDGDADVLIVKKALECSSRKNTLVVADDTDILIMLLYHWDNSMSNIYFQPRQKESNNAWSIQSINNSVCYRADLILFVHAWSGCDTTSAIFGKGLGAEGWYITKNLVVEISLLLIGYTSGVEKIQEFSVFALACYLCDFFLQMTFFTPILAVDTRRAEVGLPITDPSAWKYAFYIDLEKPEGTKQMSERPRGRFSAAIKLAFRVARYRVLQRTVMVIILFYFALTITLPIHNLVNNANNATKLFYETNQGGSCLRDGIWPEHFKDSWKILCGVHWPELFNYYFVNLDGKQLIVMPMITYKLNVDKLKIINMDYDTGESFLSQLLLILRQTSHPVVIICGLIFFAGIGKLGSIINDFLVRLRNKNDMYAFELDDLIVPNKKQLRYKLTKMAVDETDTLVCSFNNGAIYVWDLYNTNCSHYIDRRTRDVRSLKMHRSHSTRSLPVTDDNFFNEPVSRENLPRAVWCMALKSSVLVVGCDKGSVEVYSLENECLQGFHQHEVESGVVSAKVISCLRFVVAFKYGQVVFYRIRPKQPTHNRTSSLPKATRLSCVIEVTRSLKVSNQTIIAMELAVDKLFIASLQGQVKVLRASDDGGIPMYSNITRDQEVSVIKTIQVPEMAIIGTSTGYVHILNSIGQTIKTLSCGNEEVMSITSDDDYIAALAYDGVLTVWLKEGYIKWWQVNLLSYGGAYEIVSLARYSMAAINMEAAIILNIVSRTIVRCIVYRTTPSISLVMPSPIVSSNKSAISIPSSESNIYQLSFPKLIDRNR